MVSGIITAMLLALFIGGWIWAWSPKRRAEFDAAAREPLADGEFVKDNADDAVAKIARETQQ